MRSVRYRKHMATGCHPLFGIALVLIFRNETCRFYPDRRLVPRISTGKLTQENGRYNLPLSITVHHGLMDGRNVAELLQKIEYHQKLL